jgi:ankyrin repeat protein
MSFSDKLKKSIEDRDLVKFTELANHPALLINVIYGDGLLHYLLTIPNVPLEFYKVVLENVDTDVNKIGKNKLPPILSTENAEIQDLILSVERINVNIEIGRNSHMRLINVVLKASDMELFKKLLDNPRTDYQQRKTHLKEDQTLLNYSMMNNIEAFRMLLEKGAYPSKSGSYIPLEFAVKNNNFEAFKMLLEKGANLNVFFEDKRISLINYLLGSSDLKMMLDLILDKYFDKISDKMALLETSIELNNVEIFQRCLDNGLSKDEIALFPVITSIISKERYDLLELLMTKYNVCLSTPEQYESLLQKRKLDTLKIALEIGSHRDLQLLHKYTFYNIWSKLPVEFAIDLLLSDENINSNLWNEQTLSLLYKIHGFTNAIEENMDKYVILVEKKIIQHISWIIISSNGSAFDSYSLAIRLNTPIVRLLEKGDFGMDILNRMIASIPKDDQYRICDKIVKGYILNERIDVLEKIVKDVINRNQLQLEQTPIDTVLRTNSVFVMSNIDTLLRILDQGLYLKYMSSFIDCIEKNPELFMSSDIVRKLFAHYYNYNNTVSMGRRRDDQEIYSQLYYLCTSFAIGQGKTQKMDACLYLIRTYLDNPNVDINIRNETSDDEVDEQLTILEHCVLKIKDFDNSVDYTSAETYGFYQEVIKMLLVHPSFDISSNSKLFSIILRNEEDINLENLFTTVISQPNVDVNSTGVLGNTCSNKHLRILNLLLTIGNIDINIVDAEGNTPLHICIENNFIEGAMALLADPRINIAINDAKGSNYAKIAGRAGMRQVVERLAELGQSDDSYARIEREIAEYEARMAAQGRVKHARIRETLNSFDLILREPRTDRHNREDDEDGFMGSTTPYNRSLCPFCLTYIEKDGPYECVYLSGHRCPAELENEELKRIYFGDEWATKVFEVCCICGRPCEHHGHFKPTIEGESVSTLLPNEHFANHWDCNESNGGGGKLEMITRLVAMLSEIKRRVDLDERLVYGPELIRELSIIGNNSLRNNAIVSRATSVFERQGWNVASKIEKFKKFNAPEPNAAAPAAANNASRARNVREPIVYYHNPEEELQCIICLDEAEHLFKPHESDTGYICDNCIKRQVCASRYASVTCELGCRPKKQIHKEDVNALMEGNFCEGVEVGEVGEARANAEN